MISHVAARAAINRNSGGALIISTAPLIPK
jgi:hypothetical protein